MWLPIEGTGGSTYQALEFKVGRALPGVCDCGEVSCCPILTGLPGAQVFISERCRPPDVRSEVCMGSGGGGNCRGAARCATDAEQEVEAREDGGIAPL